MSAHVCLQVAKHRIQLVLLPCGRYVAAGGDVGLVLVVASSQSADAAGFVPGLVVVGGSGRLGYADPTVVALGSRERRRSRSNWWQRTTDGRDCGTASLRLDCRRCCSGLVRLGVGRVRLLVVAAVYLREFNSTFRTARGSSAELLDILRRESGIFLA